MEEEVWEKKQRWFRNRLKRLQKKQDHQAIYDLNEQFIYWCADNGWPDWWMDMRRAADDSAQILLIRSMRED